jgi:hypothetical protein
VKDALLEGFDGAVLASGSFGKGHDGFPLPDFLCCKVKTLQSFFMILPVYFDISGVPHGAAEDGDLEEFFFGNPPELTGDKTENDEDIHIALMIGHEDLRLSCQHVFGAHHLHADIGQKKQRFCPYPRDAVYFIFAGRYQAEDEAAYRQTACDRHTERQYDH